MQGKFMESPKALAMIICDDVIDDKRTRKKSLIGMFDRIMAATLPTRHPKLHVFFSLTNGRGKYKATLEHTYIPELKVLQEIHGELDFPGPNAILEYDFELLNVAFPHEGKYSFQLLLDGKPVAERIFEIVKKSPPP